MGMRHRAMQVLAVGALIAAVLAPAAGAAATPPSAPSGPASKTEDAASARRAWDQAVTSAPQAPASPAAASRAATLEPAVTPALDVSPATDLTSGQQVAVTGSGFGVQQVVLIQCPAGATPAYVCDTATLVVTAPDPSGAIAVGFTVHRTITSDSGRLDCASAPDACDLVAADPQAAVLARHALAFDPNAPLPNPGLVVTPATGLLAGDTVTVTGSGFLPSDFLRITECAKDSPFCSGPSVYLQADGTGGFSTPLTVQLRVPDSSGNPTHCLAVACVVQAESTRDPDYVARMPVVFDPNQPLPPTPAITVEPATGLLHDQTVTVTGTGFDPESFIDLSQCGSDSGPFCGEFSGSAQADAAGAFTTTLPVSRLVSAFGPTGYTVQDCATVPCSIGAVAFSNESSFELTASAPISFDGSVPPPALPVVTFGPTTDLPYQALVAIHGTGYSAGEPVYAQYCVESPTTGGCTTYTSGVADPSGTVDLSITVKRRLYFGTTLAADCLEPTAQCTVQVQGSRAYERAQTSLTFDPNAAVPPPPPVVVTPDHDLGYRQSVTVTGTGFAPGGVDISECVDVPSGPESFTACGTYASTVADLSGAISTTVDVRRILDVGFPQKIDCATNPNPCVLRVGPGDPDVTASVPLGFDPNSQPPPPPTVTVTPSTHLLDGQQATVSGANFSGNALLGMAPCRAGVTAIADACDIGRATLAMTGPDGTFSTTAPMASVLGTAQGTVDCTTSADACVWAVANAADLSEFATTPLSFDAPDLMIHSTTVTEGTGAPTTAEVMVELSQPVGSPITVAWRAVPGTAGPDDYMAGGGRTTIPAGATEAMIHLDIVGDAIDEPTERFGVQVTSAPGTHITGGPATVKIHDDDPAARIRIGDWHANEGDGTASTLVGLSAPSGRTITVDFRTRHDSARSGSDYVSTKGTVTFAPGQQWAVVTVPLVDDRVHEHTERFRVELRDAVNGVLADDRANITIYDND
jgi:hypothetical protein